MTTEENIEWVDKYRPKTLDDLVLDQKLKKTLSDMVKDGNLLNCTLCGKAGIGKTSLARILCDAIDATVLYVPCATDGTIDVIRSRIRPFCETVSMKDSLKVVILDEIDSASSSGQNNFQMALRTVIEEFQKDTRFILTCNYIEKITVKPIISRCPVLKPTFTPKDLILRVKHILDLEKVEYTNDSLKTFIKSAMRFNPDIRRIIKYLQFCSVSGKLTDAEDEAKEAERMVFVKDIVDRTMKADDLLKVREFYLANKGRIEDWRTFGADIFNHAIDSGLVKDYRKVIRMSDMIYQMNVVINPEIQVFALLTALWSERGSK